MSFDVKEISIVCETKDEWLAVLKELSNCGYRWRSGDDAMYFANEYWKSGIRVCLSRFGTILIDSIKKYPTISFEEFRRLAGSPESHSIDSLFDEQ